MRENIFKLPQGVQDALASLATKWKPRGIVVSLFGSFARETARIDSDLDIAIEWTGARSEQAWQEFLADIEALPTVRQIDVVDVDTADAQFASAIRPLLRRVA